MKRMSWALFGLLWIVSSAAHATEWRVLMEDIKLSALMQKQQHHELIRVLQPRLDGGEPQSAFRFYLLASAYSEVRDYSKTLAVTQQLEARVRDGDSDYNGGDLTAVPAMMRAFVALEQGDYRATQTQARLARELLEKRGRSNNWYRDHLMNIDTDLGIASALLGDDAEADRMVAEVEGIGTTLSVLGPQKYLAVARIRMAQKRFDKALAAVQNPAAKVFGVYTIFYDKTFQEIPKYYILTKCLYETGKLKEAKAGYDQLLKHPQIAQLGGIQWPVLLDRARIARGEGETGVAADLLRQAVAVIEKQRSSIDTEAGRIGFVGDRQAVYQELISLLVDGGQAGEAFQYVERAKSRALVDLLATQQDITLHGADGSRAQGTAARLAQAEGELGVVQDPASTATGTRSLVLDLRQELSAQDPQYASLVLVAGIDARDIDRQLDADETLLEYYATSRGWYVFVAVRGGVTAQRLEAPELEREVLAFRDALANPASRDYESLSASLYSSLIAPVAARIGAGRLTIVPHGILHYLPFAALSAGGRYLIESHSLRMLPSASVLNYLAAGRRGVGGRMLVLGNPDLGNPQYDLDHAQEEALAIARIVPGATVLLRREARATAIVRDGANYDAIHVAAHGVFDAGSPLDSALILAGDSGSDGWLRAKDLYRLRLNADLITLSACETALGKVTGGDDVVGFTRGFLYAGARAIVSSLWKVDDLATRDLMVDYYRGLQKSDKSEALRQAQLGVMRQHAHPFYWAAFQLTGRAQ